MSDNRVYIDALKRSLKKKVSLLSEIDLQNRKQRELLENDHASVDDFETTMDEKARLIEELDKLDEGFDEVFTKVKSELETNKSQYKDDIAFLQEYIRIIMDKSTLIQTQERMNKELFEKKAVSVKAEKKTLSTNMKVADSYYQNMMKMNFVDPQFLDQKH